MAATRDWKPFQHAADPAQSQDANPTHRLISSSAAIRRHIFIGMTGTALNLARAAAPGA